MIITCRYNINKILYRCCLIYIYTKIFLLHSHMFYVLFLAKSKIISAQYNQSYTTTQTLCVGAIIKIVINRKLFIYDNMRIKIYMVIKAMLSESRANIMTLIEYISLHQTHRSKFKWRIQSFFFLHIHEYVGVYKKIILNGKFHGQKKFSFYTIKIFLL